MTATWDIDEMPDCSQRTVLITGANSGLGYEATKALARQGATVVMACRSRQRGKQAAREISDTLPNTGATLDIRQCDLSSLSSVADFAASVREDYDTLDALCNNAGVMAIPRQETEDGFEKQLGVNHLGHFALTGQLLPLLVAADGESRVVTHSSGAHTAGKIDFADLHSEDDYGKWEAYSQSKLANLLFAFELQRRLEQAGIRDTISLACHPGYADTNLQYRGPEQMGSRLRYGLMKGLNAVVAQSAAQGALPLLYATTAGDAEGGAYYGPGGLFNMRGTPERQTPSDAARNEETAQRLWSVSEELTGIGYNFEDLVVPA